MCGIPWRRYGGRLYASIGHHPDGHERAWRLVLLVCSPDVSLSHSTPLSDVRAAAAAVLSSTMYASATEIRQNPVTLRLRDHGTKLLIDNG
jgi:hypothetical protein